jgi:hypothetical protein
MVEMILTYGALFLAASGIGFALGAAVQRAIIGDQLLDLDGDVQSLRIRVTEAKGRQDGV